MVKHTTLREYITALFEKMGCPHSDADAVAQLLVAAELRGIPSHGIMRVKDYFLMLEGGRINRNPQPKIVYETPSTATVDGDNGLGPVAGIFSMKLAIEKAKQCGTGWVATRNSNHFGIAGFYSLMAQENDMIGICMTNANPLVVPTNSISKYLGTNPLAVAIPTKNQPTFIADFATTPIARGKLAIMGKKGEKAPLGLVQDADGCQSDDPDILLRGGGIMTLGGDIIHGGHKGFCMTALIDIFSSVFSGANFGPFVPPQVMYLPLLEKSVGDGLGHFFGAMRVDAFRPAEEFKSKMDEWIETFRNAKSGKNQPPIIIPGDPERLNTEKHIAQGISILPQVLTDLNEIADKLGMEYINA